MSTFRTRARTGLTAIAALVTLGALGACNETPTGVESDACKQSTAEFGNSGCFAISGRVVGSQGQPLGGIVVTARAVVEAIGLNAAPQTTGSDGTFQMHGARFLGHAPSAGPDTASVILVAADPRSAGLNIPATVRDSIVSIVTIAPIGAMPAEASVQITLATP